MDSRIVLFRMMRKIQEALDEAKRQLDYEVVECSGSYEDPQCEEVLVLADPLPGINQADGSNWCFDERQDDYYYYCPKHALEEREGMERPEEDLYLEDGGVEDARSSNAMDKVGPPEEPILPPVEEV